MRQRSAHHRPSSYRDCRHIMLASVLGSTNVRLACLTASSERRSTRRPSVAAQSSSAADLPLSEKAGSEEDAGPSKRARQNARRRERQKDKAARAEVKEQKEKQRSFAKELEAINPDPSPVLGPATGFRIARRSVLEGTLPCMGCAGKAVVSCARCTGCGRLSVGGWHAKNNINRLKLAGTQWTSIEKTLGYDFFTAKSTRRNDASGRKSWLVEMAAAGDPAVRLWIPEEVLADRTSWIAGWKEGIWQVPGGAERLSWLQDRESVTCPHCGGIGRVPCPECSGVERPAAAL